MKRMQRMPTRKAHSWWWDSHISPKNNKWLADNLEEMDKQVKEMLKLIEDDGDSFAKKAEMYYQRRPLLVTHVENFYRMYRALAERYDNVTGELRKNMPSTLESQSSGISESDSEAQSTSPSLDSSSGKKSSKKNKKGSDGSSSSSSSESDSEVDEGKQKNGNVLSHALNGRINELEDELKEANEKLEALEEKIVRCECENLEKKLLASQSEINSLQKDLEEKVCSLENIKEISSERENFEAAARENKNKISELEGEMASTAKHYEAQLSSRDLEIAECKRELEQVSERYSRDKSTLETEIRKLEEVVQNYERDLANVSQEKLQLEAQVMELEQTSHSLDDSSAEIVKLQKVIKDLQAGLENGLNEKRMLEERVIIEFEQVQRELEDTRAETVELQTTISKLRADLEGALEEKSMLEGSVKDLEQSVARNLEQFSHEESSFSAQILHLSEANGSLEDKLTSGEALLKQLQAEKEEASAESEKLISELNQDIANLKTQLELMSSEKAAVDNKASSLLSDLTTRDEKIKEMGSHLDQLHLEHVKLIAEADAAAKSVSDLSARVRELEEEVEKQKLMVFDSAEGKREAIRQLCFSLEHYRDGYQQLRQALQGHKRPMVMAT